MDTAKKRIQQLMDIRNSIETEINVCVARLEAPGGAGRTGRLVDQEGFPRTDIDIHAARQDRHRIAVLTNDHKSLTDQIQKAIEELHQQAKPEQSTTSTPHTSAQTSVYESKATICPIQSVSGMWCLAFYAFAFVDSVSDQSPALAAGIQVGDELCQFGEVKGTRIPNPKILTQLAACLRMHEGKEVETIFKRNGDVIKMNLTPHKWSGPGLIGCHLRPLV